MILVLLRDVGDIGSIMGGQMNEQKVCFFFITNKLSNFSNISETDN
jgi:hypothetical protein